MLSRNRIAIGRWLRFHLYGIFAASLNQRLALPAMCLLYLPRLVPLLAALLLTGCAAAMPGYDPVIGGVPEKRAVPVADIDGQGRYVLTARERALDCKQTTGAILVTIARVKDRARSEPVSSTSTSMKNAISPLFGGSDSTGTEAEAARERAKIAAYNHHLSQKGCTPVDVEAEMAKPLDTMVRY